MSFLPALRALKEAFAADLIDENEFRQHKAKLLEQMREDAAAAVQVTPSPSRPLCSVCPRCQPYLLSSHSLKVEGQVVLPGEPSDPSGDMLAMRLRCCCPCCFRSLLCRPDLLLT